MLFRSDAKLFSIFWLLCNEWHFDEITAEFRIGAAQLTSFFARLDRLRLIDWRPGNRARLRVTKHYVWLKGGPLRKAYGLKVITEFMRSRFESPLDAFHFEALEHLDRPCAARGRRRLEEERARLNQPAGRCAAAVPAAVPAAAPAASSGDGPAGPADCTVIAFEANSIPLSPNTL